MISDADVTKIVATARMLPPAQRDYRETDFVMNMLETVVDYMTHTTAVVRALEYYRAQRWAEIRTMTDLEATLARFPDDKDGNTALAQYLWNYRMWTRADQLRGLTSYFRSIGVTEQA